jgi:putative ABC transport system substrate-binding protein
VRRRQFLFGLGGALVPTVVSFDGLSQGAIPHRIGWLKTEAADHAPEDLKSFLTALHALGQREGKTFAIEARYANGNREALKGLADDLVQSGVAVIVATSQSALDAAYQSTHSVPIVARMTMNPMVNGIAASLGNPGGNVTGTFSVFEELVARRLELLQQAVPDLRKVGVLMTIDYADSDFWLTRTRVAVQQRGLELYIMNVHNEAEIDAAFDAASGHGANGLLVFRSPIITAAYQRIIALANSDRYRLPGIFDARDFADSGGFMSFGPSVESEFGALAGLVDRVLKGAKPGTLAIEPPDAFELVINLKTAQLIGRQVPKAVQATADLVIE